MKKTFVFIFAFTLLSGLFSVQVDAQNEAFDPEAKLILDKVSKKFKSMKSFKADFTLKMENKDTKINETQKGKLYVKGDKYKIETTDLDRYSDGASIWTFLKSDKEVQITTVDPDSGEISPAQLLNIKPKDFKYILRSPANSDGLAEVDITPLNTNAPFFKTRLTINTKTNMVTKAIVFERNGSRYTYTIQNSQTDKALEDKFFTFDKSKHVGIEIVDLR